MADDRAAGSERRKDFSIIRSCSIIEPWNDIMADKGSDEVETDEKKKVQKFAHPFNMCEYNDSVQCAVRRRNVFDCGLCGEYERPDCSGDGIGQPADI
ncbi:MAG: hypothetical protein IKN57_06990 [Parasporobacterium sp.]|nr:hypothetical protein [Parasporobacterium sp.]